MGQAKSEPSVGTSAWVLYESGDIILRRSRSEADVEASACFHLLVLQTALETDLLPLRLRTLLLADGSVVLVDPAPIYELAGHDRRLRGRGVTVLPTTLCVVDPIAGEVVLPSQPFDAGVPSGQFPVHSVLLREPVEATLPGATAMLALARSLLRSAGRDLSKALHQLDRFRGVATIELLPGEAIAERVRNLGIASRLR